LNTSRQTCGRVRIHRQSRGGKGKEIIEQRTGKREPLGGSTRWGQRGCAIRKRKLTRPMTIKSDQALVESKEEDSPTKPFSPPDDVWRGKEKSREDEAFTGLLALKRNLRQNFYEVYQARV